MYFRHILAAIIHVIGLAGTIKVLYLLLPQCCLCWYTFACHVVMCLLIARHTFRFTKGKLMGSRIKPKKKAVLITGCDSGFGHDLATLLDSKGYHVFASCLFPVGSGAANLKESCSDRLKVLQLDVTKDDSVESAVEFVKSHIGQCDLWAVVNNAGVLKGCSTELTSIQEFSDSMNVNAFGAVRVTKAFLPFLRKSKGRVVNLASLAGRFPAPFFSPYTMSKYATVGLSDCLRQELLPWGVRVISVEPALFQTNISNKSNIASVLDSTFASVDKNVRSDYGEKYLNAIKRYFCEGVLIAASPKVSRVLDALENAVSLKHPDIVYQPCQNTFVEYILDWYFLLPNMLQEISFATFFNVTKFPKPVNTGKHL